MKWVLVIAAFAAGVAAGLLAGRMSGEEPVVMTRVDTLEVRRPAATDSGVVGYERAWLAISGGAGENTTGSNGGRAPGPLESRDTTDYSLSRSLQPNDTAGKVEVVVPIEQKVYSDSSYRAWVSGFRVNLDSIEVYRPVTTVVATAPCRRQRWSLGVTAGIGATPRGIEPMIGIGITYSIVSWR